MWFHGLRFKLLLFVIVPSLMIGGLVANSFFVAKGLSEKLEHSSHVRLPLQVHSGAMQEAVQARMRYFWTSYALPVNERASAKAKSEQAGEAFNEALAEFNKLPRPEWSKKIFKDVPKNWEIAEAAVDEALALLENGNRADDAAAMKLAIEVARPANAAVENALEEMDQTRLKLAREESDKVEAATAQQLLWMLVLGSLAVVGLFGFGIYFAARLAKTFGGVAEGIATSVQQFNSASTQLSGASQTLSSGASEAAASLEETVASLEELSSMVKQNAENSKEAGTLSAAARSSAEVGEHEVRQLLEAMTQIAGSSKKIEEITEVIDDLAFQTNLLALNAAVEAARAGEQGKGFAVVAEAVRNLAQKSGEAAKNINVLIKESVERVENGGAIAERSGKVLKEIVVNVKKVADLNQEIASASQEQSTGISQISKAMNQLDQATQGNAASAEETASASEELAAEAQSLITYVDLLVEEIDGAKAGGAPAPRAANHRPATAAPMRSHAAPARVLKFDRHPAATASRKAQDVIPFDDETPGKVGNTKGF